MSPRSTIIARTKTGYAGIYCHSEGYPEGVGNKLLEHYQESEKVARLIALGDISRLGERVEPIGTHTYEKKEEGTTVAYMRDRGDTEGEAITSDSAKEIAEQIGTVRVYLFEEGKWTYNGRSLAGVLGLEKAEDAEDYG